MAFVTAVLLISQSSLAYAQTPSIPDINSLPVPFRIVIGIIVGIIVLAIVSMLIRCVRRSSANASRPRPSTAVWHGPPARPMANNCSNRLPPQQPRTSVSHQTPAEPSRLHHSSVPPWLRDQPQATTESAPPSQSLTASSSSNTQMSGNPQIYSPVRSSGPELPPYEEFEASSQPLLPSSQDAPSHVVNEAPLPPLPAPAKRDPSRFVGGFRIV
ncbi:hypothetical protein CONPUDRAFT_155012 [Coniophora puteana RWD-64-598 SS2]|uniref:Transmembrane protein n=1 Tax=Coniophora puteana (strain RWD-64-598) TaxID=741705 RepID=A0A5M3MLE3_CONPW|nr:uncharacterized protein CONPUDRAFT_155012 [Coniophora puteana RWD-64-598 SS2]EIW79614.1 hypothetical protein CONPUDRAFT_155012 [Coniophora puteana RWD-64-598 SS2]